MHYCLGNKVVPNINWNFTLMAMKKMPDIFFKITEGMQ